MAPARTLVGVGLAFFSIPMEVGMRTLLLILWKVFVFGFALILPGAFVLVFLVIARRVIQYHRQKQLPAR